MPACHTPLPPSDSFCTPLLPAFHYLGPVQAGALPKLLRPEALEEPRQGAWGEGTAEAGWTLAGRSIKLRMTLDLKRSMRILFEEYLTDLDNQEL